MFGEENEADSFEPYEYTEFKVAEIFKGASIGAGVGLLLGIAHANTCSGTFCGLALFAYIQAGGFIGSIVGLTRAASPVTNKNSFLPAVASGHSYLPTKNAFNQCKGFTAHILVRRQKQSARA
ncbi:MAG: hypothetical protein OEZ58_11490 [Gammaproteobacteria bacterium]|nr:hypothetical protein [Gammaproteobacteria bacterium]